jgi:Sulfotransferase domain
MSRRPLRGRFRGASDEAPPRIVHCTHHKAGTVWFSRILNEIARTRGLTFASSFDGGAAPDSDVAVYAVVRPLSEEDVALAFHGPPGRRQAARDDFTLRSGLAPGGFRGTHLIRDPRDMVVSAWYYHLRCTEAWAVTPHERYGGRSYQEMLTALGPHDGLMAEIEESTRRTFVHMARWNYEQPEFLELRYEDLLTDERAWFERAFRHYGFDAALTGDALAIASAYSRGNLSAGDGHVRSGGMGEWRQHFTADHVARFKKLTGHLVVDLGYEAGPDW